MKKAAITAISAGLLLAVLGSGALLLQRMHEYRNSEKRLEAARLMMDGRGLVIPEAAEDAHAVLFGDAGKNGEEVIVPEAFREDLPAELFGRLIIPAVGADLPVMQPPKEDPEKYLHRDMNGEQSVYGSVYADPATGLTGRLLVLYGHHMKNGAMFGRIGELKGDDPVILIVRPGNEPGIRRYEVIAAFTVVPAEKDVVKALKVSAEKDAEAIAAQAGKTGKLFRLPKVGKEHLALVTCEYGRKDEKLIVLCEEK